MCGCAAPVLALAVPVIFGALWPGYSHVRHYISILGARNAPHAPFVNYLGFLPIGLTTIGFIAASGRSFPQSPRAARGRLLLCAFSAGYVGTAFLPCDPGCPAFGWITQCAHSLLAVCGYSGAIVGLALLGSAFQLDDGWRSLTVFTWVCAIMLAIGFILMLIPALAPWRGLTQRVAESAMFGWIVVMAFRVAWLPDRHE